MACINSMILVMTILGIRMIIGTATKAAKQEEHLLVKGYDMDQYWDRSMWYGFCHRNIDKLDDCGECWSCLTKYDKCTKYFRLCSFTIHTNLPGNPEEVTGCWCLIDPSLIPSSDIWLSTTIVIWFWIHCLK